MGSDVIVVAGATHRDGFLDEYEAQLAKADIPFHLEKLDPLPYGANSITMRRRIAYMRSMCEKFIDYERIAMTDAYDVLLAPNVTVGELMDKIPEGCYLGRHGRLLNGLRKQKIHKIWIF